MSAIAIVKDLAGELLASKKFMGMCVGLLATAALGLSNKFNLGISEEQAAGLATKALGVVSSYLLGQGLADHGKEAAAIKAEAAAPAVAAA